MSWKDLLPYLPGLAALIVAVLAYSKLPHEAKSLEGDAANKFAQAAGQVAGQNLTLQGRVEALEKRVDELEKENVDLKAEVHELREENSSLRDWADCLCGQLKDAKIEPVRMRK
jgi:predicted nuclease with TOPRIM domain